MASSPWMAARSPGALGCGTAVGFLQGCSYGAARHPRHAWLAAEGGGRGDAGGRSRCAGVFACGLVATGGRCHQGGCSSGRTGGSTSAKARSVMSQGAPSRASAAAMASMRRRWRIACRRRRRDAPPSCELLPMAVAGAARARCWAESCRLGRRRRRPRRMRRCRGECRGGAYGAAGLRQRARHLWRCCGESRDRKSVV